MKIRRLLSLISALVILVCAVPLNMYADYDGYGAVMPQDCKLRRPISPEQPMWIVHIDTWNTADPDKIIDLIPEDILPYVVFNISLSVNWDSSSKSWATVQYGYETAKSWLRTCAERQVWALIQPASGGQCHFPDYPDQKLDGTLFEEFFRDYPNFLGFNYCEQFWGFEQADFPITCPDRYRHFANLLELTHRYGGYLVDSWCGNEWGQGINPMAMLKTVPEFEEAARTYTENFILCEKYTQVGYMHDQESYIYGAWLSGYSGQYGIRYDETGWSSTKLAYTMSTGLSTQLEKLVKSGLTVIDGPELIPQDCFKEDPVTTDEEGYSVRNWSTYTQFDNVAVDMFRKVIEGSIRIPTREEAIKNTKVAIIQDIDKGKDDAKYCSYPSLFTGLYKMDGDGELKDNKNFYKKTGRYPTIPTIYGFTDDLSKTFEVTFKQSEYKDRWPTIDAKVDELNELFPEESFGNIYCGRNKNTWVIYNPLRDRKAEAIGGFNFKYNTADAIELNLSKYTSGIINEYADKLEIYLNNYDNHAQFRADVDIITITGCSEQPTCVFNDRSVLKSDSLKSDFKSEYSNGTFRLTVTHNGPVDISISVKGNGTGRLTDYNEPKYVEPARPGVYYGDRQYEAEFFDLLNVDRNVTNGCHSGINNYWGQGYVIFGTYKHTYVKDTITTLQEGKYNLSVRYALENADVSKVSLYVNGRKVSRLKLEKTGSTSEWALCTTEVSLNEGVNTVELRSNGTLEDCLYFDCMILSGERLGDAENPVNIMPIVIICAVVAVIAVVALAVVLAKKKKA